MADIDENAAILLGEAAESQDLVAELDRIYQQTGKWFFKAVASHIAMLAKKTAQQDENHG